MARWTKLLIGLAAALLAAWLSYGPMGQSEAFAGGLEARARGMVRYAELPGVEVHMSRAPLSRVAILAGTANDFQRNGIGDLPGIDGRIASIPGVAGVRWADEPAGFAIPLLAELLGLAALAWLIGLGLGWLLFRPRREGFL
jgi:hypothetical protein